MFIVTIILIETNRRRNRILHHALAQQVTIYVNTIKTLQKILYYLARDKTLSYYYSFFIKNLSLSKSEMTVLQNKLINNLITHAYTFSPYYRSIMDKQGLVPEDITCKDDLLKLPILTKSIMRENLDTIKTTDSFGKNLSKDTSSGSTGNQAILFKSPYYQQMSNAALLRCFYMTGWDRDHKSVWLWNDIFDNKRLRESIKAKTGLLINRIMIIDTIQRQESDFIQYVQQIHRFKPRVMFGNARMILEFAKYVIAKNIKLESIQLVVTSVEKLDKRHMISQAFNNSPVYDLYSSRECHGMAVELREGIFAVADDHVAINLHEDNMFTITALHSYGFPLINYQIGDRGIFLSETTPEKEPDIKNPFSTLSLKIGRFSEDFLTKNGSRICGTALMTNIASAELNASEQQIIQTGYSDFIVNYVADKDINPKYQDILRTMLRKYFGDDCSVTFNSTKEIPLEQSGKKLLCKCTFLLDN